MQNKPVIPAEKKLPQPPVYAALGMAVAYYTYPFFQYAERVHYFLLGIIFLLVFVVSFLRVIRYPFGEIFLGDKCLAAKKTEYLVLALAVGFSLGIASRQTVQGPPEFGIPAENVIAVSGILQGDPRTLHGGSGMGVLQLTQSTAAGGLRATARGSLTVFFPAESIPDLQQFGRGSRVYLDGTYTHGSRGPVFNARSVHIMTEAPPLEQFRTGLRLTLLKRFQYRQGSGSAFANEAPVWGGLASALLLGMRDDLDVDLAAGFWNSGCAHILALSGMHLAILSGVLAFLIRRPLGIRGSSLAGAVFVIFYVFIAGSQASLVRSAIMYLLGTLSVWGFLKGRAFLLLCMAFIIQLIFQSETGTSLSFILSYLALWGILGLGDTFRRLFRGRIPEIINTPLCASLGAFILTAPIVAHFFGSIKPIGILAGLVVAPVSSVFMVLALMALIASFLPAPLWNFFDFLLIQVYRFLEFFVTFAGRVPGIETPNPFPVLVFTILIWLAVIFVQKIDYNHRNKIESFN